VLSDLRIACVGEVMIEICATHTPGTAQIGVAGDVLNTAIYLKRQLGAEHHVSFISLLGAD
jgi:2-dehydro-3-deoxygluconokinase